MGVIVTGLAFMWWRAGGPNWYGAAVTCLVAAKTMMSWTGARRRRLPTPGRSRVKDLRIGVAVPFYNEDPDTLAACLESILGQIRRPHSIVVVDDCSGDDAALAVAQGFVPRFADAGVPLRIVRFDKNRGKREGLIACLDAQPDIDAMLCIDSDTIVQPTALAYALEAFADPAVKVVTGLVLALNHDRNLLTRLTDLRYANAFLFERAAYSRLGSVLCACGSLAIYRADVLRKYRDDFLTQKFLGRPAIFGDDRRLTNYCLLEGKSLFDSRAIAFTAVPERMNHYVRQQVRWNKSFFRESLWVLRNMSVRKPAFWLTFIEVTTWCLFTVALLAALVLHPILTGKVLLVPYLIYTSLLAYARSVRYFEITGLPRARGSFLFGFLLAPLYGLMNLGLLVWLRMYALFTLRSGTWGTRKSVEVALRPGAAAVGA